ncbi:MAG: hypothetical protein KAX72_03145 [Chitinophagales bacterium]|nr:hypothetical protein [Bacteroidota bacterium]MBP8249069.1 hypothetical protein [Chitinophagales bacterium]MBP9881288.1 hypothetical protein [Chitinophagales bacterium]
MNTSPDQHSLTLRSNTLLLLLFLFFLNTIGKAQVPYYEYSKVDTFPQPPLHITLDINTAYAASQFYTLSWSLIPGKNNRILDGTYGEELHCFIYDSKGLVGFYQGDQKPEQFCGFHTTDRVVDVFFRVRPVNEELGDPRYFNEPEHFCDYSEFKKIRLIVKHTKSKDITLYNNTGVVTVRHTNKGAMVPDNMPCYKCCDYDQVLVLSRYYVSATTGKILKGSQWLNRKSLYKIVNDLQLVQIDPSFSYFDKKGNQYSGQALIDQHEVPIDSFDMKQFSEVVDIIPYPRRWLQKISILKIIKSTHL